MKKIFLLPFILVILIFLVSLCKKEDKEKIVDKDFFCDVVPKGWECEFVEVENKFLYISENIDTPLFIVKYLQPDSTFIHNNKPVNPVMYLNVYSIEKEELLDFIISSQQVLSSCIPIYYGKVKPYYIVTSPCFINYNNFSNEAQKLIMPLHEVFSKKLTEFNNSFLN